MTPPMTNHGTGFFAASNADAGGSGSITDERLSASFTGNGAGYLGLSFWLGYRALGDYFEVLIDGAQVAIYTTTTTGPQLIDVSAYNDGAPHTLTMHFYSEWGWWAAFDDVVITDVAPMGKCCYGDPGAPSCADNSQAECNALQGLWTMGETCAGNPCPSVQGCAPGTNVFGQPPMPSDGAWTFVTTDIESPGPYLAYDNFAGAYGEVTAVKFWIADLFYSGGWGECDKPDPAAFQIKFYEDAAGMPGTEVASYDVSVSPVLGEMYSGVYQQKEYTATLPTPVSLSNGWISIQGADIGASCWMLWLNSSEAGTAVQWDGTAFVQLAYNLAFCLIGTPVQPWLAIDVNSGTINPGDPAVVVTATMNSTGLANGTYHGRVNFNTNEVGLLIHEVPVTFTVGGGGCEYIIGDANGSNSFNGLDVTYSVNYFKGGAAPPFSCECTPGNIWFVTGDVNGSCSFNGLDVTYMVNYFKGGANPIPCASCPPAGVAASTPHTNTSNSGQ